MEANIAVLTEGLEDYLESILLCEKDKKIVRTKHLAERLKVKSPSVNAAIKELSRLGLVNHESYGHIELTREGRTRAEVVYTRHKVLFRFFSSTLGLPEGESESTACGIEHHLDSSALKKLQSLLEFIERKRNSSKKFAAELTEAVDNE